MRARRSPTWSYALPTDPWIWIQDPLLRFKIELWWTLVFVFCTAIPTVTHWLLKPVVYWLVKRNRWHFLSVLNISKWLSKKISSSSIGVLPTAVHWPMAINAFASSVWHSFRRFTPANNVIHRLLYFISRTSSDLQTYIYLWIDWFCSASLQIYLQRKKEGNEERKRQSKNLELYRQRRSMQKTDDKNQKKRDWDVKVYDTEETMRHSWFLSQDSFWDNEAFRIAVR